MGATTEELESGPSDLPGGRAQGAEGHPAPRARGKRPAPGPRGGAPLAPAQAGSRESGRARPGPGSWARPGSYHGDGGGGSHPSSGATAARAGVGGRGAPTAPDLLIP